MAASVIFPSYGNPILRPYINRPIRQADTLLWVPSKTVAKTDPAIDTSLRHIEYTADTVNTVPVFDYNTPSLPAGKYGPIVYDHYDFIERPTLFSNSSHENSEFPGSYRWLDRYDQSNRQLQSMLRDFEMSNPLEVKYNANDMPEVPKVFRAYVDKFKSRIILKDISVSDQGAQPLETNIDHKNWLHNFDGSLQFSQAYISPNWYQGGNNNLNMIGQLIYNVNLNQKFHPKVLFDATISYKLALNSAPDDSIHSYNISEDILQINSTFGLKAARSWYYSANLMFKTQLFNSYPTNSRVRQAAFMSPGELNLGLGMTYNKTNAKKTATFGASISPLSWNLKTCTNRLVDETVYGLTAGRKTKNKVGSSAECNLEWKIAYNITYHSRLFLFTDYDYAYGDWEHTVDFNINRFLSTRLYVHMRYDTTTPRADDSNWHKFQLKEIFSFGFAYHFGTI